MVAVAAFAQVAFRFSRRFSLPCFFSLLTMATGWNWSASGGWYQAAPAASASSSQYDNAWQQGDWQGWYEWDKLRDKEFKKDITHHKIGGAEGGHYWDIKDEYFVDALPKAHMLQVLQDTTESVPSEA